MYHVFNKIQQHQGQPITRLEAPRRTNSSSSSTVISALTCPTMMTMERSHSPRDDGSEIDPENNSELHLSSCQQEDPSTNRCGNAQPESHPTHREQTQTYLPTTVLRGNTRSYSGDVSSDSTSVYIESEHLDALEIDPENSGRNFSSRHQEDPGENIPLGTGNARHEPHPSRQEQPQTYLPTGMLTGNNRSNLRDVPSESTSVHNASDQFDDLGSMEYSEIDSVPEMSMPNAKNSGTESITEDSTQSSPKRNLLNRRYILAIVAVISIIVIAVVIASQKKGGSSSIKVPDAVSPSVKPTAVSTSPSPVIASYPPVTTSPTFFSTVTASFAVTTSPTSLSTISASFPPVTSPTSSSPVVASFSPVTTPTSSSPVVATFSPVTSPTSSSPVIASYPPVTNPTSPALVVPSNAPVTSPTTPAPVVALYPPVTSPITPAPVVALYPPVTSPTAPAPVVASYPQVASPTSPVIA